VINTLAFYGTELITAIKSLKRQEPALEGRPLFLNCASDKESSLLLELKLGHIGHVRLPLKTTFCFFSLSLPSFGATTVSWTTLSKYPIFEIKFDRMSLGRMTLGI
jgi:hypothetical protein